MGQRTKAPSYKPISIPPIPRAEKIELDNGTPCHIMNIGEQEVIRIECLFPAASWQQPHPALSFFAVKMLLEGTTHKSSAQISQVLDMYGAFTETVHTPDYYGIVVYTMPKFLPQILPIVAEILEHASFPTDEWKKLLNIVTQQLKINLEQNSWLAGSKFKSALFGPNSRYGYSQNEADLAALKPEEVQQFYASHIRNAPLYLFVSGKVEQNSIRLIQQHLGKRTVTPPTSFQPAYPPQKGSKFNEPIVIEKPESTQYTFRMGKQVPGRKHADYFKILVTNEVLGGNFGSRLMKNLREEKGLTYGISSYLPALKEAAYFMIGTDAQKDSLQQLRDEIHKEIILLQSERVPDQELERVKNVMAGEFARSLGTAFEIGDLYQSIVICDLPEDFYDTYLDQIRSVTSEDIQYIANNLLDTESMLEVVVG